MASRNSHSASQSAPEVTEAFARASRFSMAMSLAMIAYYVLDVGLVSVTVQGLGVGIGNPERLEWLLWPVWIWAALRFIQHARAEWLLRGPPVVTELRCLLRPWVESESLKIAVAKEVAGGPAAKIEDLEVVDVRRESAACYATARITFKNRKVSVVEDVGVPPVRYFRARRSAIFTLPGLTSFLGPALSAVVALTAPWWLV